MCLRIFSEPKLKIATRNIKCWKVLYKDLTSIHYDYQYKFGKLETGPIPSPRPYIITGGWCVDEGFHSYTTRQGANFNGSILVGYKVVECFVPKGSVYYLGYGNEMVSDQIVVKRRVRWYDGFFDTLGLLFSRILGHKPTLKA